MLPLLKFILLFLIVLLLIINYNKNAKLIFFNANLYNIKKKYSKNNKYAKLNHSKTYNNISSVFKAKNSWFNFLTDIINNKNYYLSLARFIDHKINSNTNNYRARNKTPLIELVANKLVKDFMRTNIPNIFKRYHSLKSKLKLQKKEDKVFKYLVCKNLLTYFAQVLKNLITMSEVIQKSKTITKIKKYKNHILFLSQCYGIAKYNKNSTLLLEKNNINTRQYITQFLFELNRYNSSLIITSHYLKIMFN